jgi:hypothetical protein
LDIKEKIMTDYSSWKILKSEASEKADEYSQVAEWCNDGGEYHIEDTGEYFEVVKNPEPALLTGKELKQQRIFELKRLLANADYWGQKYLDGEYTEEEWAEKAAQRKAWREEIRQLEAE